MIWLRRFFIILILLVAALLALIFTQAGNQLLVKGLNRLVPELQLKLEQGVLLRGARLTAIQYHTPQLDVSLDSFSYQVDWSCFPDNLCLNSPHIDGLKVALGELPASEEAPETEPASTELALPLGVRINDFMLRNMSYQQAGVDLKLEEFRLAVTLDEQGVKLTPKLTGIDLVMVEPQPAAEAPATSEAPAPIELPHVVLPMAIQLDGAEINRFNFTQGETKVNLNRLYLDVNVEQSQVSIKMLELELPELIADLTGKLDLSGNYPMDLVLNAKVLEHELIKGESAKLALSGDLSKLYTELDLAGPVKADLKGWVAAISPTFEHKLVLNWQQLQWPLRGKADFEAKGGSVSLQGNLENYKAKIGTLVKGADIPAVNILAEAEGDLAKVKIKELTLGTLGGTARLNGLLKFKETIDWNGELTLTNIQPDPYLPDANANISGRIKQSFLLEGDKWTLALPEINLKGQLMGRALTVSGKVKGNSQNQWDIDNLKLVNGSNQLKVNGKVAKKLDLAAVVRFPNIADSVAEVEGRIEGDIRISGALDKPLVDLDLLASSLNVAGVSIAELSAKGSVLASAQPQGDLLVSVSKLKQDAVQLDTLKLTFKGDEKNHKLNLNAKGQPVSTALELSGSWKKDSWQGALESAYLSSVEGRWQLQERASLGFAKGMLSLGKNCWHSKNSALCIDESKLGESGEVTVDLKEYRLPRLAAFMPENVRLEGAINSLIRAKWSKSGKPQANIKLASKDASVTLGEDAYQVPIKELSLLGELGEKSATLGFTLDANQFGQAKLDMTLDPYSDKQDIKGQLSFDKFNLDVLKELVPQLDELKGQLQAQVAFDGPLKQPMVNGDISLTGAELGGGAVPTLLTDLETHIKLAGDKGEITGQFNAGNGNGKLAGQFDWQQKPQGWVTLIGDKLEIDYQSQVRLSLSPDLKLELKKDKVALNGEVFVPHGRIKVRSLPAGAVSVSDDIVIIDAPVQKASEGSVPVEMLVTLRLGDDVEVDAFGLKSSLEGQISAEKSLSGSLTSDGEIRLVNGSYRAFGQNLVINKGHIIFAGAVDKPYLSVDAIRNPDTIEDPVTAGIKLEGPVESPEITIYSEPAKSQQEALSYLLRGKSLDSSGGDDSAMITGMLIGLGVGQSESLVSKVGDTFGVQDLAVDSSGSGDNSKLTISGYIMPGVQVRYGVSLFQSMTDVALRYEVLPKLYVEAVSGLAQALDVYYEFDWD